MCHFLYSIRLRPFESMSELVHIDADISELGNGEKAGRGKLALRPCIIFHQDLGASSVGT